MIACGPASDQRTQPTPPRWQAILQDAGRLQLFLHLVKGVQHFVLTAGWRVPPPYNDDAEIERLVTALDDFLNR